jgi:hypothetical protein
MPACRTAAAGVESVGKSGTPLADALTGDGWRAEAMRGRASKFKVC